MTRRYTNLLSEALENGVLSYETVAKSFLTFLSEDQIQEFVESDFADLIEEDDDYSATNPSSFNYCLECGDDYEWFIHNCDGGNDYNEIHGCRSCDDRCGFCEE